MKKNIKILIIVLIVILILTIATFVILYFGTGIFKTNKQMFCKYISQTSINSIISIEDTAIFGQRLLKESNSNNGKLSIVIKDNDENKEQINEEFIFDTKVDLENKKSKAHVSIIQDGEEKLQINYLKQKDLYGLQFQDLIKQYIVIENNNLKEFAQKLGFEDVSNIPDKIETLKQNEEIDIEELKTQIKEITGRYQKIVIDQIPEEKFSAIKKEEITVENKTIKANGYKLSLSQKELIDIFIEILNEAKNDEQLFNIINKYSKEEITIEEYKEAIQGLANSIDRSNTKDNNNYSLDIYVYKQGKKLVKIYAKLRIGENNNGAYIDCSVENNKKISINYVLNYEYSNYDNYLAPTVTTESSEFNFSIEKDTSKGQEEGYKITLSRKDNNQEDLNMELTFSRFGKYTSQNIKLDIEFNANIMDGSINLVFSNNTKFGIEGNIEEFEEGNYAIINEFSGEQIANLIVNLKNIIFEKIDASRSLFGSFLASKSNLFKTAEKTLEETKKEQVREAMAVVKADIIAEYYGGTLTEINEEQIASRLSYYLQYSDFGEVTVTKIGNTQKYYISVEGIELDEDTNTIDLSIINE